MIKRLISVFLVLHLIFIPSHRANAFAPPVVAGAIWAVETAAPYAIRYLATEIAVSSVVKAVQVSDAYYAGNSTISKSKYLKYFKSKAALGAVAFVTALNALGLYVSNDSFYSNDNASEEPGAAEAGFFWSSPDGPGSSASEVADIRLAELSSKYPENSYVYEVERNNGDSIRYYFYKVITDSDGNTENVYNSARLASKYACEGNASGVGVASCEEGFDPNSGATVDDSQAESQIFNYLESLSDTEQLPYFGDEAGVIDTDLKDDFESENAPLMPDGESAIPNIGDPKWKNAHLVSTGVAQSSDSSADNYVSTDNWDEAYYLANDVANGNDYITGLNSGVVTVPDSSTGTDTGTGSNSDVNVTVDVSGVESRLDTSNELSENILDEMIKVNSTDIALQSAPDSSSATSFWTVKYPDGLLGVLNNFIEDIKQTPIFEWLNEFVIDIGSGSTPAFELCFNTIANIDFGCYTLQADSYIWVAIRSCMILFAVIVSRRIVFGG